MPRRRRCTLLMCRNKTQPENFSRRQHTINEILREQFFSSKHTYKNKIHVLRKDLKMKERTHAPKELHQTNAQLAGKVCRSPKGSQAPKPNVLDLLVRDRMFSV
jgi:hypothetical protein